MANETKFEIKGNYLVVTNVTTSDEYIRALVTEVNFRRDKNDNFIFINNTPIINTLDAERINVLGINQDLAADDPTPLQRTVFHHTDSVDKDLVPFASADSLDNFLSLNLGCDKCDTTTKTWFLIMSASDLVSALVAATSVAYVRPPYSGSIVGVRASVLTAPTDAVLTVDINKNGASILSTKLTIDSGEKTSQTAATPAVISDDVVVSDDEFKIDIDTVGSTIAGAGLIVTLEIERT